MFITAKLRLLFEEQQDPIKEKNGIGSRKLTSVCLKKILLLWVTEALRIVRLAVTDITFLHRMT
jgi:hypothetical protein